MDSHNQWEQIPHPVYGYASCKIWGGNHLVEISRRGSFIRAIRGTGGNYEIRDISVEADKRRTGLGTLLFKDLTKCLTIDPPYHSIFGFTRVSNEGAQAFYRSLGFTLTRVSGIYEEGEAIVFSIPFEALKARFLGEKKDVETRD